MVTLEYKGIEKSLADWGIAHPLREETNQASDSFGFDRINAVDSDEEFAFGNPVTVRVGRSGSGTAYSGGRVFFIGYRVKNVRSGSPQMESLAYQFAGPWEFLVERLTFQQLWQNWNGQANVNTYRSQVVLGQTANGVSQTMDQQLREIFQWVIDRSAAKFGTPQLQLGDSFPAIHVPYDAATNITCAEAVRRMLRWIGSTSTWVDYTTTPPTIHCRTRDILQPVTQALVGSMERIKIERLDALIPPAIHFKYRVTTKVDNSTFVQIFDDIACAAGATTDAGYTDPALLPYGLDFGVPVLTFDFEGGTTTHARAHIETQPFSPSSLDWWVNHCPELNQFDQRSLAIVPNSVNWNQPSDPGSMVNVLTKGQIAPWMTDVKADEVKVNGEFSGQIKTTDGRDVNTALRHPKQVKLTLTNLATGDYSSAPQVQQLGEPIPFGLARRIFAIESIPQYQGAYTLVESEISGAMGVGNTLNISGGRAEWATMNTQVQSVRYDFDTGKTTVNFGAAMHLGAGDLIERLRAQRGPRMIYLIGFNRQASASAADVELGKDFPKENSTTGVPVQQFHAVYEADNPGAQGDQNALGAAWLDAVNREIVVQGAPYTNDASPGDGSVYLKLADITNPPASNPAASNAQKQRDIRLREISYLDANCQTKYRIVACSDEYTKS